MLEAVIVVKHIFLLERLFLLPSGALSFLSSFSLYLSPNFSLIFFSLFSAISLLLSQ